MIETSGLLENTVEEHRFRQLKETHGGNAQPGEAQPMAAVPFWATAALVQWAAAAVQYGAAFNVAVVATLFVFTKGKFWSTTADNDALKMEEHIADLTLKLKA